jgi:hypothetical protein
MSAKEVQLSATDRLFRLASYPIDRTVDRWTLKNVHDAAYFFLGSAAHQGLIPGVWDTMRRFQKSTVYFRHVNGHVFRTGLPQSTPCASGSILDGSFQSGAGSW